MSAITTKIIEKYNLSPKMVLFELSQYTSEFLENLTNDRKRNQGRRRLREGFKFSNEQRSRKNKIINLVTSNSYQVPDSCQIPDPTLQKSEETIGDMAQWILRDKLSIRDIRAEARALANSAPNANAGSSRLSRLRRELKNLGASFQIIKATKFPDITEKANKIQRDNRKKAEANCIDYPDHFTLESVRERLDSYDVSTLPDLQAFADVMIMLCICPAELITLHIINARVTDYGLIPKYLRKLGAVYAVVVHEAENMAHAYTIAGQALRHNPDNHTSSVQNYVIVNYQPQAWLRFAKYRPPNYIRERLLIPGYEINKKNHWENFVFRIKNNLTSHKQI
ncbi:11337_t:CDS:2, partial [Gigaspora margarita]